MFYSNTKIGTFLSRPNRFLAHVIVDGCEVVCHVKNTGRLRELLLPGVPVVVQHHPDAAASGRKTEYSLIAVAKPVLCDGQAPAFVWVNIDSQAPNQVAYEWISKLAAGETSQSEYLSSLNKVSSTTNNVNNSVPHLCPSNIRREIRYGASRFDLAFEDEANNGQPWLMEVKGVTLDVNGTAMFPDAPTERGVKHLEELADAVENGFEAAVLFVIQMKGISAFAPHSERHPEFAEALANAARRGVHIWAYDCIVTEDSLQIDAPVPVIL